MKEIRFGPNTDEHDVNFKLKHARKFLEEGHKVKAFVFFRGRSIVFKERGEILLLKFAQDLEDIGHRGEHAQAGRQAHDHVPDPQEEEVTPRRHCRSFPTTNTKRPCPR
jgi:translation initiation factor IF-3